MTIDVVFCSDEKYLPHCGTAIVSLLENEPRVNRVFLISSSIEPALIERFRTSIFAAFDREIIVLEAPPEPLEDLFTSGHVNSSTYLRFMVADLLPAEVDLVLYLDSDVIVTGPFIELLPVHSAEVGGSAVSKNLPVVWAVPENIGHHLQRKGHPVSRYFNAGVMLLNLRRWRRDRIVEKLFETEKLCRDDLVYWDQDVLNIVLADSWSEMSSSLNSLRSSASGSARIVHFNSNHKPWHLGAERFGKKLYAHYRHKTIFLPYRREWHVNTYLFNFLPRPVFHALRDLKRRLKRAD